MLLTTLMLVSLTFSISAEHQPAINEPPVCNADRNSTWTVGLMSCNDSIDAGYTLFSPIPSTTSYLIDSEGREVHSWESPGSHRPALSSYLLPDGALLRTANIAQQAVGDFSGGGTAGKIERIGWDGVAEWSWEFSSTTYITHHDIEPMPNGNILAIAWEDKSEEEALQAGRNPAIASDAPGGNANVWPDFIIEIEPLENNQANIVWEWHAWDHLIQDYDSSKDNYGVVRDHPELLDINFVGATGNQAGRADWMHCNGIDYHEGFDQIALSCKNMNEIYIIDHSTTTAEAASHTGGNSGKGGDFLYRWGNPQTYNAGLSSAQKLFGQHDVQWIEDGRPGAGDLILFNNGGGRNPSYSSVDVLQLPGSNGEYPLLSNNTWGPQQLNWSWDIGEDMYAQAVSGAERLANGNTLVTDGTHGTLYEVNLSGSIVWKYVNPVSNQGTLAQGEVIPDGNTAGSFANPIFKARRYAPDHPAFADKDMTPGTYIETVTDLCPDEDALPWDRDGDGCIDDSDNDGFNDPSDICRGHDDAVDIDNDTVPDGCDSLIDGDGDGVSDSDDVCDGYNDSIDSDADGVPDGCDESPNGESTNNTETNQSGDSTAENNTMTNNTGVNNTETNQSIDNPTENSINISQPTDSNPLNETQKTVNTDSTSGKLDVGATTLSGAALIFIGIWVLLYLASTSLFPKSSVKAVTTQKPYLDLEGVQDSTAIYTEITPMIDLPSLGKNEIHETTVVTPTGPPIPDEGLPMGWSKEQWAHYGQQWLDQKRQ